MPTSQENSQDPSVSRLDSGVLRPTRLPRPTNLPTENFTIDPTTGLSIPVTQGIAPVKHELLQSARDLTRSISPEEELRFSTKTSTEETEESRKDFGSIILLARDPAIFVVSQMLKYWPQTKESDENDQFSKLPPIYRDLAEIVMKEKLRPEYSNASERETVRMQHVGEYQYPVTEPGPLESFAREIVLHLLDARALSGLKTQEKVNALKLIDATFTRYRLGNDVPLEYLPEMPDLTADLLELASKSPDKKVRYKIYDILEQLQISTDREEILFLMDETMDLEHPLAYLFTSQLMTQQESQDLPWLNLQKERQEQLKILLDQSPQSIFDHFHEIAPLARGLVITSDPFSPIFGQIGMEIEYSEKDPLPNEQYGELWQVGKDLSGTPEIRRADNTWEYDAQYRESFNALSHYLRDSADQLKSVHIHLGIDRHEFPAHFGELFGNSGEDDSYFERENHETYEHRYFIIPWAMDANTQPRFNQLDSATLVSGIDMLVAASHINPPEPTSALEVTDYISLTKEQVIFACMCMSYSDLEVRLSGLKGLGHPYFLRAVSDKAILERFTEESRKNLMFFLRKWNDNTMSDHLFQYLVDNYQESYRDFMETVFLDSNEKEMDKLAIIWSGNLEKFADIFPQRFFSLHPSAKEILIRAFADDPQFRYLLDHFYDTDPDPTSRMLIIKSWMNYSYIPECMKKIHTIFQTGTLKEKLFIAHYSSRNYDEAGIEFLLQSDEPIVRKIVVANMNAGLLEIFLPKLAFTETNPEVLLTVIDRTRRSPSSFQDILEHFSKSYNPEFRAATAKAWVRTPIVCQSEIRRALNDTSPLVLEAALTGLNEYAELFVQEIVTLYMTHPDPNVKAAAEVKMVELLKYRKTLETLVAIESGERKRLIQKKLDDFNAKLKAARGENE